MPQFRRHVVRDAELRGDTARRLGMLAAAKLPGHRFHLCHRHRDHVLEHRGIVEFRIFAAEFSRHGDLPVVLKADVICFKASFVNHISRTLAHTS